MSKRPFCCPSVLFTLFTLICLAWPAHGWSQTVFGPQSFTISRWHVHCSLRVFGVENPGSGIAIIEKNTPEKNIDGGFLLFNRKFIPLSQFLQGDNPVLHTDVMLQTTNRFIVFLRGAPGASVSIEVGTAALPPSVHFSADPVSINLGESSMLFWTTEHAESCVIEPDVGLVEPEGSLTVSPDRTTTYTMIASGDGGSATDEVTITVNIPPPWVDMTVDPDAILAGESAVLSWTSSHVDACVIHPDVGSVEPTGSTTVSPAETTTYTITATGPGGIASDSATIQVRDASAPPSVLFQAHPAAVARGESSTLSWTSIGGDHAHIDHDVGMVSPDGSVIVQPEHTTTYTITVTGPTGSANAHAEVMVMGNPEPQPEGSFGEQYEDLVPLDATVESYDAKRFSLITGLVHDPENMPIEGVGVAIHNHMEYGTALTGPDGRFSIPVEGGRVMTVRYQKDGLLAAQRQVHVPWNDIAVAQTVVMIDQDPAATTVFFDGNPETLMTHQSTTVEDEFGTRACTMVFAGDNHAYLVDENGNDVHELTAITTRATEYATPESMPAILPPTTAYTYCVELSVDGAQRVRFEKPVIIWVDNFLGFDVGMAVPVGYYDRDRGVWAPADNGRVVKLLDTDGDETVDALDANGDGLPDDLNNNGLFDDETAGLDDPGRYCPGATFWRAPIIHFSPHDLNWARITIASLTPLAPHGPEGSIAPNPASEPDADQQNDAENDCREHHSSFVEERSRIFHEEIPVPGTDITLHYAVNRVEEYRYGIKVPASGETVPEGLKRIIAKVEVGGRTFEQVLDPLPDQTAEFEWDGLDHLGRSIGAPTTAHTAVGFVYDGVYTVPPDLEQAFGMIGRDVTSILTREEVTLWKQGKVIIRTKKAKRQNFLAEGWTVSLHHAMATADSSILHKGDGAVLKNHAMIIRTAAGTGVGGFSGDGGPATEAQLRTPAGVAADASGNLYIADAYNYRVRKVDANGIITTVAGNGTRGYAGDGGPAIEAQLQGPFGVAMDSAGNLYLADTGNHRVRKVDTNGIITTVAGNGDPGFSGDGGPAVQAGLTAPTGVATDPHGNLYIADTNNHRIRKVTASGIIITVAGDGRSQFSGDGGPATEASLYLPMGVAANAYGHLLFADYGNHRVRKVDANGIITTVAGNGDPGFSGDGGPAADAHLRHPTSVRVDSYGNLYIADSGNHRVRRVYANGIIATFAGKETSGFDGDGGPPTHAALSAPWGLTFDPDGALYIANTNAHDNRVRKVGPPCAFTGSIHTGDIPFAEDNGLGHIMSATGRHKATIDLDTGVVLNAFTYNEQGQVVSVTDRFGNQTEIARDGSGMPTAVISPDGITTSLAIDAQNHLTGITYPDGGQFSFEYTPDGLMIAKTEPEGNRFAHQFDAMGKLTIAGDDEGGHWRYDRLVYGNGDVLTRRISGEGDIASYLDHTEPGGAFSSVITDPAGGQTLFDRSADGLTVKKSLPCGMDLVFLSGVDSQYLFKRVKEIQESTPFGLTRTTELAKTYEDTDSDGVTDLITETVSINGKATTLANNVLQSQKTVTSPEGRTVTTTYDPATLLTGGISIPGLHNTSYGYDTRGRPISMVADTRATSLVYNAQGFLESITDPENHTTTYAYDPAGRITAIGRPDATTVNFSYDQNGNMTLLTNPSGIGHGFGYNAVNRNSAYHTPLNGSYTYVYDRDRRLISTHFPSGKQINNLYANGRLEQVQTPEGNIDLTYVCGTKIASLTNGTDVIAYEYDGKLLMSEAFSGILDQTLLYGYNNDFNATSFTYAGSTQMVAYDDDGLLTEAGGFVIDRNAGNGLPESVTDGVMSLARTFNGHGEVVAQNGAVNSNTVADWSLTRDDNGRITHKAEMVDGVPSNYAYTYDPMGRLLTVIKDGSLVEEYQYGLNGTRTYEMNTLRGISGRTFHYSDEDGLLTAGGAAYEYNADGFLTTRIQGADVTTYDYSSRGELLGVTLPDGTVIDYVHDPIGRRIAKKVNGVVTEKYLWQGFTRLLAVYDAADNLITRFQYADDRMPVTMTGGGSTYYLAFDQVGSLRAVADASGNVIKRINYDAFGNVIVNTNPSFAVPLGFAGGLHDRDTNLVRFGFRDYDPDIGRWTAKDPILFAGGDTDLYGYCLNDPLDKIDPHGLFIGSLFSKGVRKILGRTAQEAGISGKAADSFIGVVIEMTGISKRVPNVLGYTGDALQAIGGVQSVSLAGLVASYSSLTPAAPAVLAGLGGAELGFAFNNFYQRFGGQSLGEDIYDWFHSNRKDNPCK
jgi:RHS repeat-associated protein